ncbi:MAG TPA: hypothetical protein VFJ24_02500 [Gaiellales bacterium]|nr:hypothetical protein [Gaiellales bacterium]
MIYAIEHPKRQGHPMDICIEANRACLSRSSRSSLRRQASEAGGTCVQELTILLDGITAGDYLTWVRDPEPRALGRDLVAIATAADPVAARIDVHLIWGPHAARSMDRSPRRRVPADTRGDRGPTGRLGVGIRVADWRKHRRDR